MANTSYLTRDVEPYLRDWASARLGVKLSKQRIVVGRNQLGNPVSFEFDGVSCDQTIGVCISSSTSYKVGQARKYFMEATLLNRVPTFKRRVMLFIHPISPTNFARQFDGLIDMSSIELLVCPFSDIPPNMLEKIAEIYQLASKEVGDKSGPGVKMYGMRR